MAERFVDFQELSTAERRTLREWGSGPRRTPSASTAIELIVRQMAIAPDRCALLFGEQAWTYRDLAVGVERLAGHLKVAGVGPDVVVGLSVERSPQMLVAMLAIWKAGGAYLPLDPKLPTARLKYQVEDSALRLVVVDHDDWRAWQVAGLTVFDLRTIDRDESVEPVVSREVSGEDVFPIRDPCHLAYILYTSGSTGRPKGVEVTQGGLVNLLESMREAPGCGPDDVVLATTTFTFDISLLELFLPLVSGARLVLADTASLLDPEGLTQFMERCGVTLAQATPSTWWSLIQEGWRGGPRLKVITGGEALSRDLAQALLERTVEVWNGYGPTETTIYSTLCRVGASQDLTSIGRPIANTTVWVLNNQRQMVGPGEEGELWIGGAGVARGYRGRPDLTSQRFCEVFDAETPGERMYATGDLVRWRSDGTLSYLGRRDSQVKIRGFRIELGEIETLLRAEAGVAGAVVTVAGEDQSRLVGHVVAEPGHALDCDRLRDALRTQLPDYMVPAVIIEIPAIPLTQSGKVDRRALMAQSVILPSAQGRPPETECERTLAQIWRDLLRIESVDCDTSFFALGGHSLLATRLVSRVRRELGRELPIRVVFEQPTVAGLAQWLEAQSGDLIRPPVRPEERPARLPLSAAQQRMWFLRQLEGQEATYHIPLARRLQGPLDVDALRLAVADLLDRHESLRTVYPEEAGVPWQHVRPLEPLAIPFTLASLREEQLAASLATAVAQPFDLAWELPVRFHLWQLAPDEHVLLTLVHHIAADGTSLIPLWRDLSQAYQSRLEGTAPAWQPLPVQYADYTLWQQRWLGNTGDEGSVLSRELAFWRQALADLPEELTLPTDRPRPRTSSYRGGAVEFEVSAELANRLRQLASEEQASLFMVLQGALAVLLSRLGAGIDIPLGTPIAGRLDDALQDQVGFYVNTLVTRTNLSGEPSFREVVRRVREFDLAAFAHQELPFEQLVQELQPTRSMARHPLFQVMLVLQNTGLRTELLSGVTISDLPIPQATAKFDLLWNVEERREGGLTGTLEYAADLYDRESALTLVERFQQVLEQLTQEPDRAVVKVRVLLDREAQQLADWSRSPSPIPCGLGLDEMFARQVATHPERLALTAGSVALTYAELNTAANRLAHQLIALGVGPEVLVGICLERSPEMIVAMLAVVKAGGAYLPLDPGSPPARLAYTLADAKPRAVLTTRQLAERLDGDVPRLCLDDNPGLPESTGNPRGRGVRPDHPAYVIYTSGSTGQPKGAVITHQCVTRLFTATDHWFRFSERDVWTMFHSFAFDFSVWEIWGALLYGGRLVIVPQLVSRSPGEFLELLVREQVTVLNQTPSAFYQLIQEDAERPELGDGLKLNWVIFGGEALSLARLTRWYARHADTAPRLINMYGITETTVHVTYQPLTAEMAATETASLIGVPIPDLRVHVLDEHQQPVPPGVVGEMYVSGPGVARGYLNRPELTAERFLPDPSGEPGERMYRSGDLALLRTDGTLEYHGRVDQQVKLRGFRIELGEIESVLAGDPGVSQAAVVLRDADGTDPALVAYVIPDSRLEPSVQPWATMVAAIGEAVVPHAERELVDRLRAACTTHLPAYMVPRDFVFLPRLPLTNNGKLDRKALPAPRRSRNLIASGRAPASPTEQALARIWRDLLNCDTVDCDTSFFALGGHSLLATRLVSRVRRELGRELPIRVVFEQPTVAGLAQWLEEHSGGLVRPPVRREERPARLPLSAAQQRMWFLRQLEGQETTYHIPLARRLRGPLDVDALRLAVADLLDRHESLRTVYPEEEGLPWQEVRALDPLAIPFTFAAIREEHLAHSLASAVAQPFDLAREWPVRFQLWQLAPDEHALLILVHHIAADGTSLIPLWRDLSQAYHARVEGTAPACQPLPVQYADYTLWQQRWLGSTAEAGSLLARETAFWRQALADLPEELVLPTDRPRPRASSYRGGAVALEVSAKLANRLRQLASDEQASLFMVLQGALAVLLSRLGAGIDIPLGTPIAGRLDDALHDQVGFYVNTLVTRTDLSGEPSFREVLRRVREFDLAAFAHQELPFEQLVQELQPTRSMARHPLFQVMLIVQNTGLRNESLTGLTVSDVPLPTTTAKFDLLWSLEETRDGRLSGTLEYASDLYDARTARDWSGRLLRVLEQVTQDPDREIVGLDLLLQGEREHLLAWGHGPQTSLPSGTAGDWIAAQTQRTPDSVALEFGEETWTYRRLDEEAARLARHLTALEVGRDVVVGLSTSRGPRMVVAMLAIWKAGGAYLPLDPNLPAERLKYQVEDSGMSVVLVDHDDWQGWRPPELCLVDLRDLAAPLASEAVASPLPSPESGRDPESLAYILYTSGSTGRPKGVEVTHRNLVNLLQAMRDEPGCGPDDVVLAITTFTFDISLLELFLPLVCGARMLLVDGATAVDPERLAKWIDQRGVTLAQATPVTWRMLLGADWRPSHPVRALCGGEALPVDLARDLSVRVADLWNVYGPTETTVWSTTCRVGSTSLLTSIGRAIANTRVYVLDDQRHLVPRGCVGQLWIGGMGVARGYRNRPELTVEKFVLDPFSGEAGSRMYATGDLARWSGDGTLECLGRIDRQVKIRGLRIELEEIETILRMQPGVAEVAVTVAGEASQMTERLVAHVVADPGVTLDRDALRQALRSQLPDYMVPVVLPPLAALPLTSSGKIDRRALSQLIDATADLVPCESRRPPATPSELALARIWRDLLNCDTVDCDTSFFALGGHSLLAVRLFHQIERDLGVRLPLESLFHHPTLGGLADLVDRSQSSAGTHATRQSLIQPLRSGEDPCPLFLLPSGGGNLLLWRPLVESVPEGLPVIGLQPVRDAAGSPVWNSLVESVTAMCDAVDRCQPTGPLHLMGYSAGAYMAQELARQLEDRGREVRFLGLIDTGPADYQPHWTDPFRDLGNFVRNLGYWVADNNHRVSWRNLRRRVNALRQQCGWQPSVEAMPNEHQFAQSHFLRILERHSTRTVRAPITLFRARCFPPWQYRPPCLGWTHVGCRVEVVEFPGVDHFDIVAEQHWPKLAAAIVRHLAREQPLDSQTGPRPIVGG